MPASTTRLRTTPPFLLTAAAALLTPTLPSWAQSQASAGDAVASAIQEVVVTAQKRQQSEIKTPLSLTAVTGDDLRTSGVVSAKGLTDLMAGVQIGAGYSNTVDINIRGLGTTDVSERGDPAAAFHIDGIYVGRPQGAGAAFFDIERVEVLRGPQGTLYGRNATAGAVNVITNKPRAKFAASVDVTLGNYKHAQVEAMVNAPVNDMLALRAVVSVLDRDGFADTAHAPENNFAADRDDAHNKSGRVLALLKFSPSSSALLSVDSSTDRNHNAGSYLIAAPYNKGVKSRFFSPAVEGQRNNSSSGASLEFKTSLGFSELTYLYGYREAKRDEHDSLGQTTGPRSQFADFSNKVDQNSHELRLGSADAASALQWVAGVYMYEETNHDIKFQVSNLTPFPGSFIRFEQDPTISKSRAIFGQGTYSLTPELRLTAGLRSTRDEKSRVGTQTVHPSPAFIVSSNNAAGEWSKSTWKLGVDYDLSKSAMFYANVATGYKAGGYNDGTAATNPTLYYNPENIVSYEAGVKGRFLNNKLRLSTSLFYYDYTDLQISSIVNNLLNTLNAAKARVAGAELEGRWQVLDNGRLNFALSVLDSKYRELMLSSGDGKNNTNFGGKKLDKAPSTTLSLGYTHSWALASGAGLSANVSARYSSSFVFTDPGTLTMAAHQVTQPAFTKADLSVTYNSADDRWYLQGFARNLGNQITIGGMLNNQGQNYAFLTDPRTFGVRAGIKF